MSRRRDEWNNGRRLPARPTRHLPGTAGKLRVLRRRAMRGEALFHPLDARMDADGAARIPVLAPGNFRIIGWQIVEEKTWRARQPAEEEDDDGDDFHRRPA